METEDWSFVVINDLQSKIKRLREAANKDAIQQAIFAALGCTKINYKSPRKLDEAAGQIADFVIAALTPSPAGREG